MHFVSDFSFGVKSFYMSDNLFGIKEKPLRWMILEQVPVFSQGHRRCFRDVILSAAVVCIEVGR